MELNLYILRHGETLLNRLKRCQGWIDSDLTEEGISFLVNEYDNIQLPIMDAAYCSDLGRAVKTLEIIKSQVTFIDEAQIHYSKNLRERYLGSFEGESLDETRQLISQKEGYNNFEDLICKTSFDNFIDATKKHDQLALAEDFAEFSTRIDQVIDKIINDAKKNDFNNVMVISHANTVKYIVESMENNKYEKHIEHGKIIKVVKEL